MRASREFCRALRFRQYRITFGLCRFPIARPNNFKAVLPL